MKIYSNYEMLLFKTITFTENGTSLNKQLTFIIPMYSVVGSFARSTVPQVSKYLNLNTRIYIGLDHLRWSFLRKALTAFTR